MEIQCPQCSAVYSIDESKIPEKGGRLQCKKCPCKIHVPGISSKKSKETNQDMLSEETIMERYINGKDEDGIVKSLYEGIREYVRQNKFAQAEKLREKLIDIAPMALTEIIESEEIIEENKFAAIDNERIKPWAELFDKFTKSEAADFYFSLSDLNVGSGRFLFEQGKYDNRLYFIRSGRLELMYSDNEKKQSRDIAILEKGDIAGDDAFFSFTNHTTTLLSQKDSEVCYIERHVFEKILNNNPGIKNKLFDYCKKNKKSFHIDNSESRVRRSYERYPVYLKGRVRKIDRKGNSVGDFSSTTIVDIAVGGLCYTLRNLKFDEAADLHKSWIKIIASYGDGPDEKTFTKIAKVVAVRLLPFEECTVHVEFRKPFDEELLKEIMKHTAKND